MRIKDQKAKKPVPIPKPPDIDFQKMHIAFCFRDIDKKQGQTLKEWEANNLLSILVYKIANLCTMRIGDAKTSTAINCYSTFPDPSKFYHPDKVTPDGEWASIHLK